MLAKGSASVREGATRRNTLVQVSPSFAEMSTSKTAFPLLLRIATQSKCSQAAVLASSRSRVGLQMSCDIPLPVWSEAASPWSESEIRKLPAPGAPSSPGGLPRPPGFITVQNVVVSMGLATSTTLQPSSTRSASSKYISKSSSKKTSAGRSTAGIDSNRERKNTQDNSR